ncbi:MAG: hypothetical protein J5886_00195, partial [Bacteroidales bacterium]|nr:hypothetical protein [Bacteroidales bacterium]
SAPTRCRRAPPPAPVRGWTGPPGAGSPTLSAYYKNNVGYITKREHGDMPYRLLWGCLACGVP